jgi:adenylate cyclase
MDRALNEGLEESGTGGRADDDTLIRTLLADLGASDVEVEFALGSGTTDSLAGDLVLRRGATLTARQVAEQSDLPVDQVVAMFRDLGIVVPDLDTAQFTDADVMLVQRLGHAHVVGVVRGEDLLRVVAGAAERIAEAAVAVYVQGAEEDLRRTWADPLTCLRSNIEATELAVDLGRGLAPVFRHHMRQAINRQRVTQEGVTRRELARIAVGFVDLVGSTELQAGLDPAALGEQVNRFESRAFEVITAGGGRLVKFIGDEIMMAAVDPLAGCRIVSDLVDAFVDDGTQPRAGLVFGEVLFRHGDYYGPVVNRAARLVDAAIPGEVLVDGTVVDAVDDTRMAFEPAGRRMLRGFADPVAVWSLARAGA